MSTSTSIVTRVLSGLFLGGLLALNACSVGTVTASSRFAGGGGGGGGGMGSPGGFESSSPRSAETAQVDLPVADHARGAGREPVAFRIEKDCWSCR